MTPTLMSAAMAELATAPATAATAEKRARTLFIRSLFIRYLLVIRCRAARSGHQLPLTFFQLDHHARTLVRPVAVIRLEVVDTVRADQLLRVDDRIAQGHAKLRRARFGLGHRALRRVGEQQPRIERVSGER